MPNLTAQIDDMKARWMTGGSGEAACPDGWQNALGEAPNLTLLALAGQYTRLATAPSISDLTQRRALPKLALPTMPEDLRPLFRRVLDGKSANTAAVLTFLAARGVTVHPADWMPKASAEVPDIYGPWIDWISEEQSGTDEDELTLENWDDWLPHARRAALVAMRRTAPKAAAELIAAKAGDVPAEQRLRLINILQHGLSHAETEVLETFSEDRSNKVKTLANNMLARLGKANADKEAVEEFAAFFDLQKAGMLSRKQIVVARKLKTSAQKARRWELANALPLSALASALELQPDQLIEIFEFGDGTEDLIAITSATGSATDARQLLDRLAKDGPEDIDLAPLLARLEDKDRTAVAALVAKKDNSAFQATFHALGAHLGTLDYATLSGSHSAATLQKHLIKDDGRVGPHIEAALGNLSLVASQDAAQKLLDDLTTKLGLMAADPRLAMLRLNTYLPNPPKET